MEPFIYLFNPYPVSISQKVIALRNAVHGHKMEVTKSSSFICFIRISFSVENNVLQFMTMTFQFIVYLKVSVIWIGNGKHHPTVVLILFLAIIQ
ncbi:hypothetical protein EUGRSUZ_K02347 [Eucalyptus grandis]|uniref:Uncharacterized protein n=2 Tax=Eucalyptus grandis TaxID=71139 RepID=A0ACC3IW48_EUCGR|nr:hypothetical protein EUGRSUZ_K02347 [Eucalyptus grandis]